jgi:hypothetical protein
MYMFKPGSRSALWTWRMVCFKCRVCYHEAGGNQPRPCPECRKPMLEVGIHFRAPRRTKVREWKVLEVLVTKYGYKFYDEGNGVIPKTLKELELMVSPHVVHDYFHASVRDGRRISWRSKRIAEGSNLVYKVR